MKKTIKLTCWAPFNNSMLHHQGPAPHFENQWIGLLFFSFFSHTYFEFQAHKNFRVKTANVQTQTQVRATFQSFYLFIRLLVVISFFSFFIFWTSTFPTPSLFFFLHSSSAGLFFFSPHLPYISLVTPALGPVPHLQLIASLTRLHARLVQSFVHMQSFIFKICFWSVIIFRKVNLCSTVKSRKDRRRAENTDTGSDICSTNMCGESLWLFSPPPPTTVGSNMLGHVPWRVERNAFWEM